MLSFAYVFDLFADKLTGLGGRTFTLTCCSPCALDGTFFWHVPSSCVVSFSSCGSIGRKERDKTRTEAEKKSRTHAMHYSLKIHSAVEILGIAI